MYALLCIGSSSTASGSTCALMIQGHEIWVFDSHSRDQYGMIHPDGSATLSRLSHHVNAALFFTSLASSLNADTYMLTPVYIHVNMKELQDYISEYVSDEECANDGSIYAQQTVRKMATRDLVKNSG